MVFTNTRMTMPSKRQRATGKLQKNLWLQDKKLKILVHVNRKSLPFIQLWPNAYIIHTHCSRRPGFSDVFDNLMVILLQNNKNSLALPICTIPHLSQYYRPNTVLHILIDCLRKCREQAGLAYLGDSSLWSETAGTYMLLCRNQRGWQGEEDQKSPPPCTMSVLCQYKSRSSIKVIWRINQPTGATYFDSTSTVPPNSTLMVGSWIIFPRRSVWALLMILARSKDSWGSFPNISVIDSFNLTMNSLTTAL